VERFRPGDWVIFLSYRHLLAGMEPIFHPGDFAVVAAVDGDGALICFHIDLWGRVFSAKGDTLFHEEVLRLGYAKRVPLKRLPRPYGDGDNELIKPTLPNLFRTNLTRDLRRGC
jgi:hypothetical protein